MMLKRTTYANAPALLKLCLFWALLAFPLTAIGQEAIVRGEADTTHIRIGEQITYTITVEADSSARVIFPEGQTFSPLETVEAFKTDTTRKKDRLLLQRRYALTQFDSGTYLLPRQFIDINGRGYLTDSLMVQVGDVPVDTTQQKLYDIKPAMKVDRSLSRFWRMLLTALVVLALAGAGIYLFARKRPLMRKKEASLPPYDRALLELKRLENSQYLIHADYKGYYSDLTGILRSYLEDEAHIAALESTSGQLLERMQLLRDAGELELDEQTLRQFRKVLQTADLVKFARSKPATREAEADRAAVEQIVRKTHDALPEPSEEELMEEEARLAAEAERLQRRRLQYAGIGLGLLLVLGGALAVSYYGWNQVRDELLGTPTKTLLESEWVRSDYGFPPVTLESPEVLLRKEGIPGIGGVLDQQRFEYQHEEVPFQVGSVSMTLQRQEDTGQASSLEAILSEWEREGARNLITKEEKFTTPSGVAGVKVFGTGNFPGGDDGELVRTNYVILLFGGATFEQQVYLSWPENDEYGERIATRILETVDVKSAV